MWGNDYLWWKTMLSSTGQYNAQYIFSNSRSFTAVKQYNTMCDWGVRGYGVLECGTTTDMNISSNLTRYKQWSIEPYE